MLTKFAKYEFGAAGKIMLVIYAIIAAANALLIAVHSLFKMSGLKQSFEVLRSIMTVLYVVLIMVMILICFLYLCVRFYQTMYSSQGYLTHTLPVKTSQIVNIKLLSAFTYMLLTLFVCLFFITAAAAVLTGEGPGVIGSVIRETISQAAIESGLTKELTVSFIIVTGILAVLSPLLICAAGLSLGQLSSRSKGARGIVAIIALYYISQIISVVILLAGFFISYKITGNYSVSHLFYIAPCMMLLWIALYYIIIRKVAGKHLNLE